MRKKSSFIYLIILVMASFIGCGSSSEKNKSAAVLPSYAEAALASAFTFSPSSPLMNQNICFNDASTGFPVSWSWNFGDGTSSTLENPGHTYMQSGSFMVTLMVSDESGTNSSSSSVITVFSAQQPDHKINTALGRPSDSCISANILAEAGMEAFIKYGTAPGEYSSETGTVKSSAGEPLVIEITGLKADTRYYYSVNYRASGELSFKSDSESAFHTQRASGSKFTFGVQGDSHPERTGKMFNPDLYMLNLQNAAGRRPDFYFMLGDDFSIENLLEKNTLSQVNVDNVYLNQRGFLDLLGNSSPLFLVNGNHEEAAGYLLTPGYSTLYGNAPVFAGKARTNYFALPAPDGFYTGDEMEVPEIGLVRDYYAWQWGDALFVVIDPYWHSPVPVDTGAPGIAKTDDQWLITMGDEQYAWLKQTLEESNAKYKFLFAHHINGGGRGGAAISHMYEWGGYDRKGVNYEFSSKRPTWDKPIHKLMNDNHVTIFFFGHDHVFAREKVDGVVYQSVPNPADNTYTAFNSSAYCQGSIKFPGASYDPGYGVIIQNSGYLNVTVTPENVTVSYIRAVLPGDELPAGCANGAITFSYSVKAE